ncbi:3-dehydroquinate synthase [Opitutales bacterium]|nr:3-dehydroquinate synthase [Opitutales bacterium]
MEKSLTVSLGSRSYPIDIGRNLAGKLGEFIQMNISEGRKGVALVDENFKAAQPEFCRNVLHSIPYLVVPSGEGSKSIEQLSKTWDFLAQSKIDRSGFLLAIGGGVVGDLAGFAAASFLRGISFHQVPTTLLAMVDSSVGGKTGINLSSGKNLVGSFHQPDSVVVDLDLLKTLPNREFSAGMGEVIKYGMLGDSQLFNSLLVRKSPFSPNSSDLCELIERCCAIKAKVVQSDERETSGLEGGRALLNLGHTFAHAIEKVAGYGSYLHGEAVAIGLVCALRLSQLVDGGEGLKESSLLELLGVYNLPVKLKEPLKLDDLVMALESDKKVDRGVLRFVLLRKVGEAFCSDDANQDQIVTAWKSVGAN